MLKRLLAILSLLPLSLAAAPAKAACPNPPSLSVTANTCAIQISWSSVPFATNYTVTRGTSPGIGATILNTSGTAFVDGGVVPGTRYYYRVRASVPFTPICPAAVTDWSQEVSTTTASIPAPTGLSATAACSPIVATWNAMSGAIGYVVQFSSTPDFAAVLESAIVTATSFTSTLPPGDCFVRVRANTSCGSGAYATASGRYIRVAGPVSTLYASELESCRGVLLSWQPAANATSYTIIRRANNIGVALSSNVPWFVDTGANINTDVTYTIYGVNECGPVGYSPGTASVGVNHSGLRFIERPRSVRVSPGQTVVLRARVDPVVGANARFQWQTYEDGYVIDDGRITGANTPELTIRDVRPSDVDCYELVVRRPGVVYYDLVSANVMVDPACRADFNGNGLLSVQDLFDFLAAFFGSCF